MPATGPRKQKQKNLRGPYSLGAQTMRGWEAGFNYSVHFHNKSYSLVVGLHGMAVPRNYDLFIPKEDFTPALQENFAGNKKLTRTIDMYLSLPILIEKRWLGTKNNCWNISTGVAVGFYPDEIYEGYSSYYVFGQSPVFRMDLLVSSDFKPWLNYVITGGHAWTLRNNNMIRVNLQANYTSFNLAKGDYEITVPGMPVSTGTYNSRLTGAGISLQYIFTSSRKNLLKEFKKSMRKQDF